MTKQIDIKPELNTDGVKQFTLIYREVVGKQDRTYNVEVWWDDGWRVDWSAYVSDDSSAVVTDFRFIADDENEQDEADDHAEEIANSSNHIVYSKRKFIGAMGLDKRIFEELEFRFQTLLRLVVL